VTRLELVSMISTDDTSRNCRMHRTSIWNTALRSNRLKDVLQIPYRGKVWASSEHKLVPMLVLLGARGVLAILDLGNRGI
jgi:hypothetical protein